MQSYYLCTYCATNLHFLISGHKSDECMPRLPQAPVKKTQEKLL